jgi:ATP-binding cassette subfamily B protein
MAVTAQERKEERTGPERFPQNAALPRALREYTEHKAAEGLTPLFAIAGDMELSGRYGESGAVFYEDRLIAYDKAARPEPTEYLYSDLRRMKVRRMYGNALLRCRGAANERVELLRFTYAAAEIAEEAARFAERVEAEGYDRTLLEPVQAAYDHMRSFCPKCGRKLEKPGAECIGCAGKKRMIEKFMPYFKPQAVKLILCCLTSVLTTVMDLVPPYITGKMVDTIIPQGVQTGSTAKLMQMVLVLLGTYVFQWTVGFFRDYHLRMAGDRMIVDLKRDIYAKAQYLPMSFFDKTSTGSVINIVNNDASKLQSFILRVSQEALVKFFLLVGLVAVMFAMDPKLSVLSLLPVPIIVIGSRIFGRKIAPKYRRIWRRGSAISSLLADTIPGVRVIKAFTNEDRAIGKFGRYLEEWYKEDKSIGKIATLYAKATGFLVTCGSLVIWTVGGGSIIRGTAAAGMTIGLLVTFITYAGKFYDPVSFFANFNDVYQDALASVEKILSVLDAEPERDFGKGEKPRTADGGEVNALRGRIEFKNVSFSFDRSKKALSNINLVIEPGDTVGIVGTTGSGKSTLINLLMRYYDDYEGEIIVDGVDLRKIDMAWYREQIGFVQQEPLMFRDTIFNNIAYGTSGTHPEAVLHAAEVANAHGFIGRLPDAYDTMLGERGVGLSGGERQRVSIARAVLKNPGVLIFDEATAAVDSETEKAIQEAIERLIRGRTTLMIAHRLSTLRRANKIIVVDKGEILEFGHPDDLLAMKGKYYKLVQIQTMGEKAQAMRAEERL